MNPSDKIESINSDEEKLEQSDEEVEKMVFTRQKSNEIELDPYSARGTNSDQPNPDEAAGLPLQLTANTEKSKVESPIVSKPEECIENTSLEKGPDEEDENEKKLNHKRNKSSFLGM